MMTTKELFMNIYQPNFLKTLENILLQYDISKRNTIANHIVETIIKSIQRVPNDGILTIEIDILKLLLRNMDALHIGENILFTAIYTTQKSKTPVYKPTLEYEIIKFLVGNKELLLMLDNDGNNVIQLVAEKVPAALYDTKLLEILKMNKEIFFTKNNVGDTALHSIMKTFVKCNYETVEMLTQADALFIENDNGDTPLHISVSGSRVSNTDYVKVVKLLIHRDLLERTNKNGETPFYLSLKNSMNKEIVEILYTKKVLSIKTKVSQQLPIHVLALKKNITTLPSSLVNLKCVDSDGNTPLNLLLKNNTTVSESVLKYFSNEEVLTIPDNRGNLPIHTAVYTNKTLLLIDLLIPMLSFIDHQDSDGNTPLHLSVKYKYFKITDYILKYASRSLAIKNRDGDTPTHMALKMPLNEITEELLLKMVSKTPKDFCDDEGNSLLHLSIKYDKVRISEFLLSNKKLLSIKNREGLTPLLLLLHKKESSYNALSIKLVDKSILDSRDKNGDTALHIALRKCMDYNIFKYFVECPNILEIKNNKGETPLDIFRANYDEDNEDTPSSNMLELLSFKSNFF